MPFSEKMPNYPHGYFDENLNIFITPSAVKADLMQDGKKQGSYSIYDCPILMSCGLIVIVDSTEHNPNVLFELGMRIAFSKPICLIVSKRYCTYIW